MIKLSGLKPESVFSYFEEICAIPHGSGNTKQISDYLVAFAKKHNLAYVQDVLNNVIIFGQGTCGYENHPPVILQGHMDMVCEKDENCAINMETDGLDVTHDGEFVFAKGTTLGGDDGIAVAYILALLSDPEIPHPPIEAVITVDEETGMFGADFIDLSTLKGRTLINIDSEDEGVFTAGCAGGVRATITMPITRHAVYGPCIRLTVDGLQGGHSGVEIHKNRANANKVMGEFLSRVQKLMPVCLTSFSGGSKDNAIPRSCQATMVMLGMNAEQINTIAQQLQMEIREQYDEPEALVYGDNVDALGGNALPAEQTALVTSLLCSVPNGVQSMSSDVPNLVQTSLNLGIAKLEEDMVLSFGVRSSVEAEKEELISKLSSVSEFHNAKITMVGDYPAWEYRTDSPLRDKMIAVYQRMYQKEPVVDVIHAGLECGLLGKKIPNLDCISLGPQMYDIHTSRERLDIASVERTWDFLKEILKEL